MVRSRPGFRLFLDSGRSLAAAPGTPLPAPHLSLRVHVVSHTHWDREWYHPAERFRQRLVALIDELLEDLPGEGQCFLLDGQTVVVEDYLEIRPERASDLAAALRAGKDRKSVV